jgi:dihydrofolate reductase
MCNLIAFEMVTLDGFFAGPNGEIDWHHVGEEFNEFATAQLDTLDALIFGRATYHLMASYWPTPAVVTNDPIVAGKMNAIPKIVCSRTLEQAEWENTRLVTGDAAEALVQLKQQPGNDVAIFGSGTLVASLAPLGLIDEYRLMVNPVVLGNGRALFHGIQRAIPLKLLEARPFRSGNVLLRYEPANEG